MFYRNLLVISLILSSIIATAQETEIEISGVLLEDANAQSIPYATIALYKKDTKEILTGTTTGDNGKFKIKTSDSDFYIEISFMGFKTKTITQFAVINSKINLGVIKLVEDSESLTEVVVRAGINLSILILCSKVMAK